MPFIKRTLTPQALQEIEALGDVRGMVKALQNADPDTRLFAAVALGRMGGTDAMQALIHTLENDPIGSVRYFAAASLGQVGGKEAIPALTEALLVRQHDIHQSAAEALGEIALRVNNPIIFEPATKRLIPLLKANQNVRESVITALGKIRDPRTTPALAAVMAKSHIKQEIRYVTEALIRIGKPAVQPLIQVLAQSEDLNAIAAAYALGRIADPAAVPALIGALNHRHDEVRRQAAMSLGRLQARSAVPALIKTLEDNDAPVRVAVAHALGEMQAAEAIDTLQSLAVYDFQATVRNAAEAALRRIEGET